MILLSAAIKLDAVVFFPPPHNTPEQQAELCRVTGVCQHLCASPYDHLAKSIAVALTHAIDCKEVPSLDALLDPTPVTVVPYDRTMESRRRHPFVILHTSGTTGSLKPLALPHGYYIHEDMNQCAAYKKNMSSAPFRPGTRLFTIMSLWHAGGIFFGLLKPILNEVVAVSPVSGLPITAELVKNCLKSTCVDVMQTPPSLLSDMVADASCHTILRSLNYILTGSGPMPPSSAQRLLRLNRNVFNTFGLTETDLMPQLPLQDSVSLDDLVSDWQYQRFHPSSGAGFRILGDGLYELIIVRADDGLPQPCFEIYSDASVFRTKDIFSAHPTGSDLWRWVGRLDDIITFSTDEKMFTASIEQEIANHPDVKAALLIGQGRHRPALLLEIHDSSLPLARAIENLWPTTQAINARTPKYQHIDKSNVTVTDKSFLRTPKGTIKRSATEEALKGQISKLYMASDTVVSAVTLEETSFDAIARFINTVITDVASTDIDHEADLFSHGILDSMSTMSLVRRLNHSLGRSQVASHIKIGPSVLYSARCIGGLAATLHRQIGTAQSNCSPVQNLAKVLTAMKARLDESITRARVRCEAHPLDPRSHKADSTSTLLTGSTGSLGLHLLHTLLHDSAVKELNCLNRSPTARQQHLMSFPDDAGLISKANFYCTNNLSAAHLGLDEGTYLKLKSSTTTIIHNAWPVHFHLPVATEYEGMKNGHSFDKHLDGITSLIRFAVEAALQPQFLFISSLSSVLRAPGASSTYRGSPASASKRVKVDIKLSIPEAIVHDPSVAVESGYGQSKWLGEQLLDHARKCGVRRNAKIIRTGQIAGPLMPRKTVVQNSKAATGSLAARWDPEQAIPSMIISSRAIGALPDNLGDKDKMRWIPVDMCAKAITEIANAPESSECDTAPEVYNITNTAINSNGRERTWSDEGVKVAKASFDLRSGLPQPMEVVSLPNWIQRVEVYGPRAENPAFQLLDFFESLGGSDADSGLGANIDTEKGRAASATLRKITCAQGAWLTEWMEGWGL